MKTGPLFLIVFSVFSLTLQASDWPQWLGPNADGVWRDTDVVQDFEAQEPKILWSTPVDWGYSGPTVKDGVVYLFDYVKTSGTITNNPGAPDALEGKERVRAMDAETGEVLWSYEYEQPYFVSYPGGPRCVPVVFEGYVYALGAEGRLTCLHAETGAEVWTRDFKADYGAETPIWGHSAHPLVLGDTVFCMVGGDGSTVVAFDRLTGEERWKTLSATGVGYCPPSLLNRAGVEQLIVWHTDAIKALNPKTGEIYWDFPLKPNFGMAIMPPRPAGNYLFASGMGRIGALLELGAETPSASLKWRSKPKTGVYCANSTPFILDGTIFGCNADDSQFIAVDLETGERLWSTQKPTLDPTASERSRHGTAFITFHEPSQHFYLFSENGDLIVVEPSRDEYREVSRWKALEPTNTAFGRPVVWTAPAFAMQSAFLRNDKALIRVSLKQEP